MPYVMIILVSSDKGEDNFDKLICSNKNYFPMYCKHYCKQHHSLSRCSRSQRVAFIIRNLCYISIFQKLISRTPLFTGTFGIAPMGLHGQPMIVAPVIFVQALRKTSTKYWKSLLIFK